MSSQFDTFGFTAAEVARKHAEKEQQKRSASVLLYTGIWFFCLK